jgi:hypothetical protein
MKSVLEPTSEGISWTGTLPGTWNTENELKIKEECKATDHFILSKRMRKDAACWKKNTFTVVKTQLMALFGSILE